MSGVRDDDNENDPVRFLCLHDELEMSRELLKSG